MQVDDSLTSARCHKLEFLDLQDNTFTESGSAAMAKALPSWKQLKQLNLGDCLLGPKGGIHLDIYVP